MEYMLRPTEDYFQQPSTVHSKCNYDGYQLWVVTIRSMQAVEMSFLQRVFGLLPIDTVRSWVFIAEPPLFQFEGS